MEENRSAAQKSWEDPLALGRLASPSSGGLTAWSRRPGMLFPPLLLLNLFVVLVMLSMGLRVTAREMLEVLRNRTLLARAPVAKLRADTRPGLAIGKHTPAESRSSYRHHAAGYHPGNSDGPAIHPQSQDALGIRCCDDLCAIGGKHRCDTLGRRWSLCFMWLATAFPELMSTWFHLSIYL